MHGVGRGTGTLVAQDAQTDCAKNSRSVQVITKDKDFNGVGEKMMCALGAVGNPKIAEACSRAYSRAQKVLAWEATFKPVCRGEGSAADAARHDRWSCELYSDPLTKDFAQEILRRHENRSDDECVSHEQDLNNNEVGRANAAAGKDCTTAALQDLEAGRLQVNNPPPTGSYVPEAKGRAR